MAGRSSRDPTAPPSVLLLVGHGASRGRAARDTLQRHADAVRRAGAFEDVAIATLRGAPALEDVVPALAGRSVVVLPMFMSDGYLAREELPQRLNAVRPADTPLQMLPAIGIGNALTRLALRRLLAAARAHGSAPDACCCLLVAHGNVNDPRSRACAEMQAQAITAGSAFGDVRTAFIEEAPGVLDALAGEARPVLALGLFAAEGRHAGEEVPEMLRQVTDPPVIWLGAIGADPDFADVIMAHAGSPTAAKPV